MIDTKLTELLPEEIPDEAVWYLVNFMSNLALALENHYFAQLRRYEKDNFDQANYF
jgi:hypothetical protein